MLQVQRIACVNNAGFVMNFSIQWLDNNGNWNTAGWNSGNYPIDQTQTSPDLAAIGVAADAIAVRPWVNAIAGLSMEGTPMVSYAANNQTATFVVAGTTLGYSVKLT